MAAPNDLPAGKYRWVEALTLAVEQECRLSGGYGSVVVEILFDAGRPVRVKVKERLTSYKL